MSKEKSKLCSFVLNEGHGFYIIQGFLETLKVWRNIPKPYRFQQNTANKNKKKASKEKSKLCSFLLNEGHGFYIIQGFLETLKVWPNIPIEDDQPG